MGCPRPLSPTVPSIPSKGTEPQSGTGLGKWDSHRIPMGNIGIQWIAVSFWEFPGKPSLFLWWIEKFPSLFLWWIELLKISTFTEVSTSQNVSSHQLMPRMWCVAINMPYNQQRRKHIRKNLWKNLSYGHFLQWTSLRSSNMAMGSSPKFYFHDFPSDRHLRGSPGILRPTNEPSILRASGHRHKGDQGTFTAQRILRTENGGCPQLLIWNSWRWWDGIIQIDLQISWHLSSDI